MKSAEESDGGSSDKSFDWDALKHTAFGALRLKPDEFWTLTLVELLEMVEAYSKEESRRIEMEYDRTAWLAANIMNASGNMKKPISADDLLGRKKKANEKRFASKEDRDMAFEELQKRFGKRV